MNDKEYMGERLKEERQRSGLSLSKLAEKTETLSKSRISNYEQGIRRFGVNEAKELSYVLNCSAAYLLGMSSDREGNNLDQAREIQEQASTYGTTNEHTLSLRINALPASLQEKIIQYIEDQEALAKALHTKSGQDRRNRLIQQAINSVRARFSDITDGTAKEIAETASRLGGSDEDAANKARVMLQSLTSVQLPPEPSVPGKNSDNKSA